MTGRTLILALAALLTAGAVFLYGPIAQDPGYHGFADTRSVLGIPNGLNILSNILFIAAGAWGAGYVVYLIRRTPSRLLLIQYLLFFTGLFLIGAGSSWYHLRPSNASLIWDRLPMSVAFMAFFASVISESIDRKTGALLLGPLLALGLFSVFYWAWTGKAGQGDLRLYALVQFLPLVLIPLVLIMYKPPGMYAFSLWIVVILYLFAKLFELFDRQVFDLTGMVSGHTLKHVFSAAAAAEVIRMLYRRTDG